MERIAKDWHDPKKSGRHPGGPSLWLLTFLTLYVAGGATCYRQTVRVDQMPPPQVFESLPTLEALAEVINRTDAIGQLSSNSVSVEVPGMRGVPTLRATLAVDRPRNFRMRASVPIMLGSGMDLGSNDESFWFQVPEGMSQTLYYASHEQFQRQPIRSILPVDPTWISDALGLVHLDTRQVVEGPIRRTDGRLEVRTMVPMSDGLYSRVCIIEPAAGYVTDQMLYGPDGRMIAAASGSLHRYYADQQCSLPHRVLIKLLPTEGPPLELRLDIGTYVVNQLISGDPQLFAMPRDASRRIDLSAIGGGTLVPPPGYGESYPDAARYQDPSGAAGREAAATRPMRSVYLRPAEPHTAMMQSYR